jgi:organic hydroperoxide reductase OsmC/OhrA
VGTGGSRRLCLIGEAASSEFERGGAIRRAFRIRGSVQDRLTLTVTKQALRLTEMVHEQCYISNSLGTDVVVEPTVEFREKESAD